MRESYDEVFVNALNGEQSATGGYALLDYDNE